MRIKCKGYHASSRLRLAVARPLASKTYILCCIRFFNASLVCFLSFLNRANSLFIVPRMSACSSASSSLHTVLLGEQLKLFFL